MKKRDKVIIIMVLFILLWLFLAWYTLIYIPKKEITFTESKATLHNPARGFYVQFDSADTVDMKELRENGITTALVGFNIRNYVDCAISSDKLDELRNALETARENGIKVILRCAYGFDSEFQYKDPTDLETIFSPIEQIAPIVGEYKQNILCVQAGFLGPWGEWHSRNLLSEDETKSTETRNALLKRLLEAFDESIVINVRRPRFLRDAIEAGLNANRLGIHNDALLSTKDDMGTYDDPMYTRAMELEWLGANVPKGIHGGEMPEISEYSAAEQAIKEFQQLNITYLNRKYNEEVINTWISDNIQGENAYEVINNHLGYRLYLKSVILPEYMKKNRRYQFEFELENTGYAAIMNGYTVTLVVRNHMDTLLYPLNNVMLHDIDGGKSDTFQHSLNIPAIFLDRTVEFGFQIKRTASEIIGDNLDCVILANDGLKYEEGVNYFAIYEPEEDRYSLKNAP